MAWGLRAACLSLGVRIHERSPVHSLRRDGAGVMLRCETGTVRAAHAALATNAFPALLRRIRPFTVPVYDYALMTEPLSAAQLEAIGWRNRQGIGDVSNQFHYYRLSRDNRILWGGYDAIYHWRNGLRDELDQRPATFDLLAQQFFETFPQLDGLRFSHAWGGAIDTSTRFFAFQRTALGGRVAYSLGYTGLGVGATRFGASTMLDLLAGRRTEATTLAGAAQPSAALPAGTAEILGDRAHHTRARPRRPQRRPARPVAAAARPTRPRLRLLMVRALPAGDRFAGDEASTSGESRALRQATDSGSGTSVAVSRLSVSPRKNAGAIARQTYIRIRPRTKMPMPMRNTPPMRQCGGNGISQLV